MMVYLVSISIIWAGLKWNSDFSDFWEDDIPPGVYVTVKGPASEELGMLMFQYAGLLGIAARNRVRPIWKDTVKLTQVFQLKNITQPNPWDIFAVQLTSEQDIDELIEGSGVIQEVVCPECFMGTSYISKHRNTTLQGAFHKYTYFQGYEKLVKSNFKLSHNIEQQVTRFLNEHKLSNNSTRIGVDFDSVMGQGEGRTHYFVDRFMQRAIRHLLKRHAGKSLQIIITTDDLEWMYNSASFRRVTEAWNTIAAEEDRIDVIVSNSSDPGLKLGLLWQCDGGVVFCGGDTSWWGAWGAHTHRKAPVMYCQQDTDTEDYHYPSWDPL